jgi:hypothetical protein
MGIKYLLSMSATEVNIAYTSKLKAVLRKSMDLLGSFHFIEAITSDVNELIDYKIKLSWQCKYC